MRVHSYSPLSLRWECSEWRRGWTILSLTPFLVVIQISCTWANIISLNTCHAGNPCCVLLVFKYECHCNEMDIAKMEDNLPGTNSESAHFIMEIGLKPNWHKGVTQKMSDLCSAGPQWICVTFFFLTLYRWYNSVLKHILTVCANYMKLCTGCDRCFWHVCDNTKCSQNVFWYFSIIVAFHSV